ncbi:hypothetical protein Shyd_56940 [Streptomyces hydrogenans]|uniref:DUF4126 domain-containing protein n=1 Tax=Streptomyces hydrogenans TaxID=1873719 RepID=A0ABQ3PH26_9ACTN|nr:hypothetical protein Shyd_56940 [Streptomyces hydrogenans]
MVLLLGLFGATGLTDEVPEALQRTDVLIVAGVLFLCEAVADKIPYVDNLWDSVHTVIRPVAGAVVAALLAGESGSLPELAAGGDRRNDGADEPSGQGGNADGGEHLAGAVLQHRAEHGRGPRGRRDHHLRDLPIRWRRR